MISVVVCTYNPRPNYLARCLESIRRQTLDRAQYEIVIVDNASGPPVATLDAVEESGARVVLEPRRGLTAAKERAARTALGDLIVFVDDDNVLDPNYVERAVEILADGRIAVLGGEVLPEYEEEPEPWFHSFEDWIAVRRLPSDHLYLTSVPEVTSYYPIGAGSCVRRALLVEYFDRLAEGQRIEGRSGATLSSGEDIDIDLFAVSRGYLVGVSKQLRLLHLIPPRRTNMAYVTAIVVGTLESLFRINSKWRDRFGRDPVPIFTASPAVTRAKIAALLPLAVAKRYRVLLHKNIALLRLTQRRNAEMQGTQRTSRAPSNP